MIRPLLLAVALLSVATATAADVDLPVGSAPEPIAFEHFPTRLHAVVWRNWQLVAPATLARVLGATEAQVNRLAASMGLPPAGELPPGLARRAYITVLRRNWHLLPYEQLLPLVGMSAEELAFSLREDDFLFVKMGNLKPRCSPVKYAEPDAAARSRAAEIKGVVEARFGDAIRRRGEPRFAFVDRIARVPEGYRPPERRPGDGPRYLYSYFGSYGDPLADGAPDSYPDGLLARLSQCGVNGVWLHVVLRQLAPGGPDFPEFGAGSPRRLANLGKLVDRAHRFGIDVYLYMNEPRAMPEAFFARRPEMAGVREGNYRALCTSDPRVRAWMSAALAHVFRAAPGLGGVFTITASENFTNCASHGQQAGCPRCKGRTPAEIIAEVNTTIAAGVHRGSPQAKVLAWDWGWPDSDAIKLLPKDVWLMSVSEWSLPIERGGVKNTVAEYSLSAPGPGPRATAHWKLAREHGLKTAAKLQLNNTWELSAVPWLPVLDLVAEHCAGLAKQKVDGAMLSWSLGGYPSPNLLVAERFARDPAATPDAVLDAIAADRYGPSQVPKVRAAWKAFSTAFREFPYDGAVLYQGPQQFGPANLLFARPTGYHATMVGFPYDDLNGWRGSYPAEVFAGQFAKVAAGWLRGVSKFTEVTGSPGTEDQRLAQAAGLHFASTANQARFILARDTGRREDMARLARAEAGVARVLYDLTLQDSRIGFESSNQYYYVPLDLVEKVVNCEFIAAGLAAGSKAP
jgi:hypothetical protein